MEEEIARPAYRKRALALPAVGLLFGAAYALAALRYPTGTLAAPGAGLFPVLVGVLLVASSAIAFAAEWRRPSAVLEPAGPLLWRVPALLAGLIVSAYLLKIAGFLAAATLLGALVLAVAGRRRAWAVIVIASAISAATALVFRLLGVPLPGVPL